MCICQRKCRGQKSSLLQNILASNLGVEGDAYMMTHPKGWRNADIFFEDFACIETPNGCLERL